MIPFKSYTILIIFFIQIANLYAQEDKSLNIALEKLAQASTSGDINTMFSLTFPRLIQVMGGKASTLKILTENASATAANNTTLDSLINYNRGEIKQLSGISYKYIPQLFIMSIPDQTKIMIGGSSCLALKEVGEKNWTFLALGNLNEDQIDILLPEFKGKNHLTKGFNTKPLIIPKQEKAETLQYLLKVFDDAYAASL